MKPYTCALLLLMAMQPAASAQQIPRQSLEDSLIGWTKVHRFAAPRAPITVDGKRYSSAQLGIADSLANWIQASYTPRGALGQIIPMVSPKLGLYDKNDAALPQTYGAVAHTYMELKHDKNRKLVLYSSAHLTWSIRAHHVFGEPVQVLNTPTQHYFLMPGAGQSAVENAQSKRYDLSGHPAVKRFITYFNDQLRSSTANATFVVLSRDNKSPFVQITRAEYLDKLAGAVERKHAAERDAAIKGWPEGNARANALRAADDRYNTRVGLLATNRERYAGRLQEAAEVFSIQPDELLENYKDVFEGSGGPGGERYPVYKVDPEMAELAKTDQPQWITVWWDGDLLDPVGKQQHDAILNNFDFQYVYDFFFAPEKVKGRPYKPLRSPEFREPVVVKAASEASRKSASDASVHLFEDFSTTAVGRAPNGWTVGRTSGTVANLDGLPGNWVVMAGDARLAPTQMRPLPQNFTLTYELVAMQHFTWGAKGLTLQLANEKSPGHAESFLQLKLRPGYDGREGEAVIETRFPAGYLSGTKWLTAPGFSNDKQNNHITVSVKKTGETLEVSLDGNRIARFETAIPSGLLFNAMSFFVPGSTSDEKDRFYVSQIRISKE